MLVVAGHATGVPNHTAKYTGNNYIGHNYAGHTYIGHIYTGHNYNEYGKSAIACRGTTGSRRQSHSYTTNQRCPACHNYIGHNYISAAPSDASPVPPAW